MRFLIVLALFGLLTAAGSAFADAGTGQLNRESSGSGGVETGVACGTTAYFLVPVSGSVNSVEFGVTCRDAYATIVSDIASETDQSCAITFHKTVSAATDNGSMIPTADSTGGTLSDADGDAFVMYPGKWWMEVATAPLAGSGCVVLIEGGRG